MNPKLRDPRTVPSYALPLHSRELTADELIEIHSAIRTGIHSPLEIAHAFDISRSLACSLFVSALRRSPK